MSDDIICARAPFMPERREFSQMFIEECLAKP